MLLICFIRLLVEVQFVKNWSNILPMTWFVHLYCTCRTVTLLLSCLLWFARLSMKGCVNLQLTQPLPNKYTHPNSVSLYPLSKDAERQEQQRSAGHQLLRPAGALRPPHGHRQREPRDGRATPGPQGKVWFQNTVVCFIAGPRLRESRLLASSRNLLCIRCDRLRG